ncbi:ABC transporter substrate-binding protein [Mahella australiensis]|uniref:Extracellular solute-binding protein family 1 n=1 Tax=Mahella australiensis (strain DSM 15567 / CIP 107919 / 50-1 BON) TaxID=697281 RepID=F4A2K0_MAHA5|nr:ABC transporter substrate-binding protein [Mahella australiensis]AEE97266.1 extracellular solute-binding protein family 1 [Mahella australiensis 50-1 BON]
MYRKGISVFLAFVILAIVILGGCGADTDKADNTDAEKSEAAEENGETGEVKEFTAFFNYSLNSLTMPFDTPIGKKITELTGIKLKVEYLVGTDARQKAGVMIASGDYPDLVNPGEAAGDFVAAGAFIPLDDYIEKYGTNIKKIYRPSELALLKSQYGKTYYISGTRAGQDKLYPAAGFYVALDVLKDAGWPVIKTLPQYTDIIKSYVKENPTYNGQPTIGFVLPTEAWRASALQYGGARFLAGYPNDGPVYVDQETLEAKTIMTADFSKDWAKWLNGLWRDGLMDPETFMQNNDQYLAKLSSGRVIGFYDQRGMFQEAINALEKEGLFNRAPIGFPVVFEGVEKEYYAGPAAFATQTGIAITTKCKDPEAAFKFLDRMAAEDINKLNFWGIEGEDYTIQNGKMTKTEEQWKNYLDPDYQKKQGISQFMEFPRMEDTTDPKYGVYSDGNPVSPTKTDDYFNVKYKDYEKEVLKAYNIKTLSDFFAPQYPARYEPGWAIRTKMPADHPGKIAVEKALELALQYLPKAIMATNDNEFENIWKQYQNELGKLDLKAFEDEVTKQIKESVKYYQAE